MCNIICFISKKSSTWFLNLFEFVFFLNMALRCVFEVFVSFYVAFAIGCSFRCACISKSKDYPTCSHGRNVVTRKCKPSYL